ncbi:hypothetical protein F2P56_007503 [Juglans regia]|uniref:CCHC-type domain-containing protein n=1 Tax=Juglans regia TaxID=51240 RepID=A0A833XRI3_JUGRE|nr:hypothetical protein F2P56_007503 [Juglans regia]
MQLKEELTLIQRGNRSITEYLHAVKALADEIAIIDHPISDDDLTLYVLNAYLRHLEAATQHLVASANFMKMKTSAQGGSPSWSFKKNDPPRGPRGSSPGDNSNGAQHDGRRSNNNSGRPNNSNRRYQPKCQLCDQFGHIAKSCPQFNSQNASINCATTSNGKDKNWLLDSAASHNITGDLSNLSLHSEYDGTDEVIILGDGLDLAVLHIGSLALHSPHRTFTLRDTLCDKITGVILLKGACNNGIYTF